MFANMPAPRVDVPVEKNLISYYNRQCNLPSRTVQPFPFNSYGSQQQPAPHLFYRTSSRDYGWFPPTANTISVEYFPISQRFSNRLHSAGMYRNYSLNTARDTRPF